MLDEGLASKLEFVKEGEFVEKGGAATLKLIGDVVPVEKVEVIRRVKENLTKVYPLSALELVGEIKKTSPSVKQNAVWRVIAENDIKNNQDYSAYNFRSKNQEDKYKETGVLPKSVPSIYSENAVQFIVEALGSGLT